MKWQTYIWHLVEETQSHATHLKLCFLMQCPVTLFWIASPVVMQCPIHATNLVWEPTAITTHLEIDMLSEMIMQSRSQQKYFPCKYQMLAGSTSFEISSHLLVRFVFFQTDLSVRVLEPVLKDTREGSTTLTRNMPGRFCWQATNIEKVTPPELKRSGHFSVKYVDLRQ